MKTIRAVAGLLLGTAGLLAAPQGSPSAVVFEDVSQAAGLDFWHFSGATGAYYFPESNAAGGGLIDYDGDGDLDLYLLQGTSLDPDRGPADAVVPVPDGWQPGHRLYRNELVPEGHLRFTDVTDAAGVGHEGLGMGVAVGDFDNDGDADLYVTHYGPNVLYRNDGDGTFTDVTARAGVAASGWSSSAAWIDYDRDGLLDLAVVRYVDYDHRVNKACFTAAGERDYCAPQEFRGTSTRLFRNRGDSRFEDVTSTVGLDEAPGPGLGILTGDFDADGWMDFVVANDGAANHLWLNRAEEAHRVFRESGLMRGMAYASDGQPRAGMGVAAGDLDGDGREDVVVTNLPSEGFTLYRQASPGEFVDFTVQTRLLRNSLPFTGFGVAWIDLENRGIDDLFVANGAVGRIEAQRDDPYPYRERNLLLRNLGGRRGFENITDRAGPALEPLEVSRAAIAGDVDNDGGVDIVVTNNNGPVRLLRNAMPDRGHWLLVALAGTTTSHDGFGSQVAVHAGATTLRKTARSDGSYLSANDPRLHFGLGTSTVVDRVSVHWLGGACEQWTSIDADRLVTLHQGEGAPCDDGA